MIGSIKNKLFALYHRVISSIAFYPSLIATLFFIVAITLMSLEDTNMTHFLQKHTPYLVINNADTARSILSTLIGGVISLTVFSFSMVMVLLNQASSNFSPRLLPGLISDKRNQFVLGIYLGTIIYNILILISILPTGDSYTLNGFSVLIGIAFGILSLAMFVFFIHTISTGIQINNILQKIFVRTKNRLLFLIDNNRNEGESIEIGNEWQSLLNENAGYYQGVNLEGLKSFAKTKKTNIKVLPIKGTYILPKAPILKVDTKLSEDDRTELEELFIFESNLNESDNYILGIKQITEVGVKAMSPGINDPGTTVMTIDYLTELIALRMKIDEREVYKVEEEAYKVELRTYDFETLLYNTLAAYRQYSKHDLIIMQKLIHMLQYLIKQDCKSQSYIEILEKQLEIVKVDIENNIENKSDLERLLCLF